jgi:hypothetical protein
MLEHRSLVALVAGLCVIGCSRHPPVQSAASTYPSTATTVVAPSTAVAAIPASMPKPVEAMPTPAQNPPLAPAPQAAPVILTPSSAPTPRAASIAPSDQAIRAAIIQQSLANYYGSCPCPYNTDRGGRQCGGRSAYSRPGGQAPFCYDRDISDEMVSAYRARLTRS